MTESMNLKDTVNLPNTEFPIRAGLEQREPSLIQQWESAGTYQSAKSTPTAFPPFILHDGPPYPNGNIHLGHALNKVLKDIIIRSRRMAGHSSYLIPGWDCHGLPIETQVIKELKSKGEEHKKSDISWFRNRCKEFALDYVNTQKEQFKRLGIWAEWDTPYLTLNPEYEANVIRLFGEMATNGVIYKGRKPIHWCMHCETALAEAEIEYAPHKSPSIFVTFKVTTPSATLSTIIGTAETDILVWTTTPWTLPANVAIAAHPEFQYTVLSTETETLIVAEALADKLIETLSLTVTHRQPITGAQLDGTITQHPLFNRPSPIVMADYVTQDDGTGFVHIAPGHGQDDYLVGLKYNLPTIMPVDDQGRFTKEVPWEGQRVFEANKAIGQELEARGTLKKLQFISHSYPHCWRCKNPVIFRATPQWFVAMDTPMPHTGTTLRQSALSAVKATEWIPQWGENRIQSMVENRPDWCISRQRYWGIPIPVFNCTNCGHSEMTGQFNLAVVNLVREHGTMAWYDRDANAILPEDAICSKCGQRSFNKETDILDVWFESGASFGGVLESTQQFPADMYLEGSDQHRGWFQSSLLIALAARGTAPYKTVLTHGFLVDDKGRKMSKSEGNVVAPESVIKEFGADILRWWVANADFKNDVGVAKSILNQSRDTFSKVRNTIRFCLSNLYDFNAESDPIGYSELQEIDQWALAELSQLITDCRIHYHDYDLHLVTQKIHHFCAVTLSALYLDMTKDRLYCDGAASPTRRSTQTAIYHIANHLIHIIAPILVFTAEDAFAYFNVPAKTSSVHLSPTPAIHTEWTNTDLSTRWTQLLTLKDEVYQHLEPLRKDKVVKSFLEVKVKIESASPCPAPDLASILIVSQVEWAQRPGETTITVAVAEGDKCQRCWKTLPVDSLGLCNRCAIVVTQ